MRVWGQAAEPHLLSSSCRGHFESHLAETLSHLTSYEGLTAIGATSIASAASEQAVDGKVNGIIRDIGELWVATKDPS